MHVVHRGSWDHVKEKKTSKLAGSSIPVILLNSPIVSFLLCYRVGKARLRPFGKNKMLHVLLYYMMKVW